MMSHLDFKLVCGAGGQKLISFHGLYLTIKNETHDSTETCIIPYRSISFVFEEHLNASEAGVRHMNIHLVCGAIHTIETYDAQQADEILMHLLKNTLVYSKAVA